MRLFRARGEERQRVFAAADALRREVNGDDGHLRRHAEHPVHERLLLPLRLLRLLEGQARGEPARRAVPRPARGDRPPRRRGVGARRDRGLPPGRDPPGLRRRLLRLGRARDQGRGARAARARVQRARDLAGRGDARRAAARLPRAAARRGARVAAGHGRRGARRRGARGHLPGQDHDRAVARGARDRARGRAALEQHDHVRPRRRPARAGRATCVAVRELQRRTGRLHRVRAAAVRPHGGADLPAAAARAPGRRSARCC